MQTTDLQIADERAEVERLRTENAQLREEIDRERENGARCISDFNNYRRRTEREREKAEHDGKREMILSLLDLMDDFRRALEHIDQSPASVSAGLHAMQRRLAALLEVQGVAPLESTGHPFDPALHEAVGSEESDKYEPGIVLDELRRGYRWGQELLRPARVRVAR